MGLIDTTLIMFKSEHVQVPRPDFKGCAGVGEAGDCVKASRGRCIVVIFGKLQYSTSIYEVRGMLALWAWYDALKESATSIAI